MPNNTNNTPITNNIGDPIFSPQKKYPTIAVKINVNELTIGTACDTGSLANKYKNNNDPH